MRRILALSLTLLLLQTGIALSNHLLTGAHVYLFMDGLFIVYAAVALPLAEGLIVALLAGGVCDANAPVHFGTQMLLFASVQVLLFVWRDRLPHDQTAGRVIIALLANVAIFLVFSLLQLGRPALHANSWPRLAADLLCSEAVLVLIAPWFFALQEHTLALVPPDPARMF